MRLYDDISFLLSVFIGTSLIGIHNGHAMECPMPSIPEEFPGHTSRQITGIVNVSNHFDPLAYQQDEHEAACIFNSMMAGIMHTPYGHQKVQEMILYQDEHKVFIRFHFPSEEVLRKYERGYPLPVSYYRQSLQSFSKSS